MARPSRYSPEVRERAIRMVFEHQEEHGSQWGSIRSIASKIACSAEILRAWVRQAERDQGVRPGLTPDERKRMKELERENRELRRANEIPRNERERQNGYSLDFMTPAAILYVMTAIALGQITTAMAATRPDSVETRPVLVAQLGHTERVTALTFSSDGRWVASGDSDGVAILWDRATGRELRRFPHGAPLSTITISPDGTHLLTGSRNRAPRVWSLNSGIEILPATPSPTLDGPIACASISSTETVIAVGSYREVMVWNFISGQLILRVDRFVVVE